jgi:hypothetical protein
MVGLLGPVDAVAHSPATDGDLDAELREPVRAAAREPVVDVAAGRRQSVVAVAVEVMAGAVAGAGVISLRR